MALIDKAQLIAAAAKLAKSEKTASVILETVRKSAEVDQEFDVFLSHSLLDAVQVLGLQQLLEGYGHSVYVDWIADPQLDRAKVNRDTAALLRHRMRSCRAFLFALSGNSSSSKWMPWELGYFDGQGGRVAVVPVASAPVHHNAYVGQEYLSLYPYLTSDPDKSRQTRLWVQDDQSTYVVFEEWLNGTDPRAR